MTHELDVSSVIIKLTSLSHCVFIKVVMFYSHLNVEMIINHTESNGCCNSSRETGLQCVEKQAALSYTGQISDIFDYSTCYMLKITNLLKCYYYKLLQYLMPPQVHVRAIS